MMRESPLDPEARRERKRAQTREWSHRNPEKVKEKGRVYRRKNRARLRAKHIAWSATNAEKVRADKARWQAANPEKTRASSAQYYRSLRATMIDAYGGICSCCGETEEIFLTLARTDEEGEGRRGFGRMSKTLLRRLRDAGWPHAGFQLLCRNCQHAVSMLGTCPHKQGETATLTEV
jgi:hypothetical protein